MANERRLTRLVSMVLGMLIFGGGIGVTAQADEIAGIWQSIGYGLWFTVEEDAVNIYQVSDMSCLRFADIPDVIYNGPSVTLQNASLGGIGQFLGTFEYELILSEGLLNFEVGKLHPIQAERRDSLPPVCDALTTDTPPNTFDTFWHIFNENYAFFEVRGVDWQSAYETYRPMITPEMPAAELFTTLQEMIAPLGDGHVSINSMFDSFSPIVFPVWFAGGDESANTDYASLTTDHYLIDEPRFIANNRIAYGRLSETVGYVNILQFTGFSDDGDDTAPLTDAMAVILNEFEDLDAIVVDVRFNIGGEDNHGLWVAGYFTERQVPVFSKSVWFRDAFYPLMAFYVEPTTDTPFTGDVYLLTSGLTLSAGETFALAMSTLPNVTLIGEPTNGIFSDAWFGVLPNAWLVTLSNERYLSAEGISYEGTGVLPDVEILMTAEDFAADSDPVVEAAIELAQAE